MQKQDHYHCKAVKSNYKRHWDIYKKLRITVDCIVKSAKWKYYCNLIEQSKGDAMQIQKAVNEVSSRKMDLQNMQCIISDSVQYITPNAIALAMNTFFAAIGQVLADKITPYIKLCQVFLSNTP